MKNQKSLVLQGAKNINWRRVKMISIVGLVNIYLTQGDIESEIYIYRSKDGLAELYCLAAIIPLLPLFSKALRNRLEIKPFGTVGCLAVFSLLVHLFAGLISNHIT